MPENKSADSVKMTEKISKNLNVRIQIAMTKKIEINSEIIEKLHQNYRIFD